MEHVRYVRFFKNEWSFCNTSLNKHLPSIHELRQKDARLPTPDQTKFNPQYLA